MAVVRAKHDRSEPVREAIRIAATKLFEENGFEATGIRDIARDAGVNPAIVLRHFESKENLFLETMDSSSAMRSIIEGPLEELGARVVGLVAPGRQKGLEILGATIRASSKTDIRRRLHESIAASLIEPLIDRIDAPDAELRAHLFAAQLIGLMTAFAVYDDQYLLEAPLDGIIATYGDSLQALVSGPHLHGRPASRA